MPVLKVKNNGEWQDTFGISSHTHTIDDITNFPDNCSDADTLDGKHADEFALVGDIESINDKIGDKSVSEQIASAIPTSLKNPNALTIDNVQYDGSASVDITDQINSLIDAKIDAITNAEEVSF